MKVRTLRIAALAAAGLLAGCASSGTARMDAGANAYKVDAQYVARVEAIARQRGVDVEWVNPPRTIDRR
ncbi:hypothetical protein [Pseudomarimonas salicorniae]|uniref:Uncharacterized protein n=1 Tax=Pseudomarimonas salicorniae TaxID=2933270 RepID=A0ABT0GH03_9GAMM|nr:hypothetical protein [Lysobacter sp. CAU 1642]MCK7593806.1 hypothetical protein [Lysobacter sp. CAU 1642]